MKDNNDFDLATHMAQAETHTVFNQPVPLENYSTWLTDIALRQWVCSFDGDWDESLLEAYGRRCGRDLTEAGFQANQNKPTFASHDRFGNRIDLVSFHPAYHKLMRIAIDAGITSMPWKEPRVGAHVARAALEYQHTMADAGSGCPLTMTFAAYPVIARTPEIAKDWIPKLLSPDYDPRNIPWFEKSGVTIGMAMTEKQGGSDVRANTTRAYPTGARGSGQAYELVGHKWFCSAPMSDAFLTLAQTEKGLSCFLLPRWRSDGSKNQFYIQRLKDKLGNISNASSEVEFRGAQAWLLGEEGRGVRTIIDMVALTRFDCMVGSAALMRAATAHAIHHTAGRRAFGKPLHEQVLMQNVLADLALESEAALAISMATAQALDAGADPQSTDHEQQKLFIRLATPIGKYWICKRAPQLSYEAMECIGGVGYVEENILPRLYREAPVNAIWEGSGNVQCLDMLRAIHKEPAVLEAFLTELEKASQRHPTYDAALAKLKNEFTRPDNLEYRLRRVADQLATVWQAGVLMRKGEGLIAEAFIRSRLEEPHGVNYGSLPEGIDCHCIMRRAKPWQPYLTSNFAC